MGVCSSLVKKFNINISSNSEIIHPEKMKVLVEEKVENLIKDFLSPHFLKIDLNINFLMKLRQIWKVNFQSWIHWSQNVSTH